MSGFRDMVASDIRKVFLNTAEFAEVRSVRYDGDVYPDIPVVLEGPVQGKRDRLTDDRIQGLHTVTAVLYCAKADLGNKLPEHGTALEITTREGGKFFQRYYVVAAVSRMGMLHIELEAIEQ